MSWDDADAPRPEHPCAWCSGTGYFACGMPATMSNPHGDEIEHRPWLSGSLAHRCGQCDGSGVARVVSIR